MLVKVAWCLWGEQDNVHLYGSFIKCYQPLLLDKLWYFGLHSWIRPFGNRKRNGRKKYIFSHLIWWNKGLYIGQLYFLYHYILVKVCKIIKLISQCKEMDLFHCRCFGWRVSERWVTYVKPCCSRLSTGGR